ncbi:solute carrier family 7, member 6 opposite strand [Nesidiocoris tenuis]|uniref:Probable RNA polymerase II nuclear localization protein SLC7A6OS n=1 Tax=Nesidiocoris tenuis TaxID=355587 RepID=A0ABN7AB90_9HEMI|nr:solute carrier family 7, member 6 opposite strand [Nesidiocoris tenuis]
MALVRVKRRAQDDPIDCLLIACKKYKAAESEETSVAKVFKFAATVVEQEDFKAHINRATSTQNASSKYRENRVTTLAEKLRKENKLLSHDSRLKVVNCFRALDSDSLVEEEEDTKQLLTVVDIESLPTAAPSHVAPKGSNSSEGAALTTEQYVYDLYYSQAGDLDDLQMENILSAHGVDEKLIFGDYINHDEDDSTHEDDDDSNDENNWRNDYPDEEEQSEDEDRSIGEEDMRLAMGVANMNINGEYESDLSTDDDDEGLVYGREEDREYYYDCAVSGSDSDYY